MGSSTPASLQLDGWTDGRMDGWIGASLIVSLHGRGGSEQQTNGTFARLSKWMEPLQRAAGGWGRRL